MKEEDDIVDTFLKEEASKQLRQIDELGATDHVVASLSEETSKEYRELVDLNAEGTELSKKFLSMSKELEKVAKRYTSKRFLFWDKIEQSSEQLGTATQRGKILSVKQDEDGKLVVVEEDAPDPEVGIMMIKPPEDE
jgi:hypothetical protein